eukprot:g42359.t1
MDQDPEDETLKCFVKEANASLILLLGRLLSFSQLPIIQHITSLSAPTVQTTVHQNDVAHSVRIVLEESRRLIQAMEPAFTALSSAPPCSRMGNNPVKKLLQFTGKYI